MKIIKTNNIAKIGKMKLVPIFFATTILLSSCSVIPNGKNARYKTDSQSSNYVYSQADNVKSNENDVYSNQSKISISSDSIPMQDIKQQNLNQIFINFSNTYYEEIKQVLDSENIYYDYENLYNFTSSLGEYSKLNFCNIHKNIKIDKLDVETLKQIIKKNNKEYKEKNKSSIYKEVGADYMNYICNIIISTVNDFVENHNEISEERIKCVLSDLKLFQQKSSTSNAFVTNDNSLIVSPNMMQVANLLNGKNTEENIIVHEIMHLLQKGCNCDLEKNVNLKRNFGICYGFDNVKVNSLDFTWIYEASAEKSMSNYTGSDVFLYKNMVGYLESLSLVNILNDNYNVGDTENLSFKHGLDELYNYFNATTDVEKHEILNLMYSIEVMQQQPSDFYNLLEEQVGRKKDASLVDEVNYTVKSSICQTLTKLFYKNLAKNIVNKEVTLEDVFYLISLFENDINNHILYNDDSKYEYNEEFIKNYIDIQDNFFYELSKCMNCSQEEIEDMFNNYTAKIKLDDGAIIDNYSLNFLSSEKKQYLKERQDALSKEATVSIRTSNKKILQKVYN